MPASRGLGPAYEVARRRVPPWRAASAFSHSPHASASPQPAPVYLSEEFNRLSALLDEVIVDG